MADRKLTLIIVPETGLETRTLEVSYRRLKLLFIVFGIVIVAFIIMVSSWWYVAARAALVPGLMTKVESLEEDRARVTELAELLNEVEGRYEQVRRLLDADPEARDGKPLLPPLRADRASQATSAVPGSMPDSWPLTQAGYITRSLSDDGAGAHPGIDIAVPQDAYIRAVGSGTVREAGNDEIYGRYVLLDHGDGYESMYGHASQLFVTNGDNVERHEIIALSGSTGRSTAPHLHFELRKDGEAVDPLPYLHQP